jgi:hypothetical protein
MSQLSEDDASEPHLHLLVQLELPLLRSNCQIGEPIMTKCSMHELLKAVYLVALFALYYPLVPAGLKPELVARLSDEYDRGIRTVSN